MVNVKFVEIYKTESGKEPFNIWLESLDKITCFRVRNRIERLKRGSFGDRKSLSGGLKELRMPFGSGYRIYYCEEADKVILLNGGDKSTQKKDISLGMTYLDELKKRLP